MGHEDFATLLNWLLGQDPLVALVILLLLRSEIRTGQTLKALGILAPTTTSDGQDSKGTPIKSA